MSEFLEQLSNAVVLVCGPILVWYVVREALQGSLRDRKILRARRREQRRREREHARRSDEEARAHRRGVAP